VGSSLAQAEQELILATLEQTGGKKLEAAKVLGISLTTLYSRINVYRARGVVIPVSRSAAPGERARALDDQRARA
jgi:transposase